MTKLAELAPLFEMTAAELRQYHFDELLAARVNPFSMRELTEEEVARADAKAKEYDRAAKRHQLWVTRLLRSAHAGTA
jgi:hypothetical protein